MSICYYSHLLLSSSHRLEIHPKPPNNSHFKAPLEQVILIEHLSSQQLPIRESRDKQKLYH